MSSMQDTLRSIRILDKLTKAVDQYKRILDNERTLTGVGFKILFDRKTKEPFATVTPILEEREEK